MIRELSRRRVTYLLGGLALLTAAVTAGLWAYDRGDDSAEADVQVVRWVNVTLTVPEGSGFTPWCDSWSSPREWGGLGAWRDLWAFGPESSTPAIFIESLERDESRLVIDAVTGKVIEDSIGPQDRAAVDQVLQTVTVSPLDRSTAPWPYSGQPPSVPREKFGNITFIPPDPAAGICFRVQLGIGPAGTSGASIEVNNGRSVVFIRPDTGAVGWEPDFLVAEDKAAFDRFLSTVEYVGP